MPSSRRRLPKLSHSDWITLGLGAVTLGVVILSLYYTHWSVWVLAAYGFALPLAIYTIRRLRYARAEAERRIRHLTALSTISNAMRANLDLPELLEVIRQCIEQLLDAPIFFVALYDADTSQVSFPLYAENGKRQHLKSRPVGGWVFPS